MKTEINGFTLIELMIVVAIIGVLAAIALPAYQDYTTRAKISEGVVAASVAKVVVGEAFLSNNMSGLEAAANEWNANAPTLTKSKYLRSVTIDRDTGVVTVMFDASGGNGLPTSINGKTVVFAPSSKGLALTPASSGVLEWSCASQTFLTATQRGLFYSTAGTLPAKYAPSECR